MQLPESTTLGVAKEKLRQVLDDGDTCPCCAQRAQRYNRKLTSAMARVLIMIYRSGNRDYFKIDNLFVANKTPTNMRSGWTIMKHWDLIKSKSDERDDGSPRTGNYKITDLGIDFVERAAKVPSRVYLYNDKHSQPKVKPKIDSVMIDQVLGKKFNYLELMKGTAK